MKKLFLIGLITMFALFITTVWAGDIKPLHTSVQAGLYIQFLGTSATAKDKWRVTCPAGTLYFEAQVRDRAPVATPVVSIKVTASSKPGSSNFARQDNVDGGYQAAIDLTGFSSYSRYTLNTFCTGPATFDFEVYKSAVGAEDYDVSEHCRNAAYDLGNGTNLTPIQNQ